MKGGGSGSGGMLTIQVKRQRLGYVHFRPKGTGMTGQECGGLRRQGVGAEEAKTDNARPPGIEIG